MNQVMQQRGQRVPSFFCLNAAFRFSNTRSSGEGSSKAKRFSPCAKLLVAKEAAENMASNSVGSEGAATSEHKARANDDGQSQQRCLAGQKAASPLPRS